MTPMRVFNDMTGSQWGQEEVGRLQSRSRGRVKIRVIDHVHAFDTDIITDAK